jgi:hypothetical protein
MKLCLIANLDLIWQETPDLGSASICARNRRSPMQPMEGRMMVINGWINVA